MRWQKIGSGAYGVLSLSLKSSQRTNDQMWEHFEHSKVPKFSLLSSVTGSFPCRELFFGKIKAKKLKCKL
jgi:hypothetical protein